ncbi:MAG: FxsA family protein [Alphaproteobacteria bacterium]|nr:FxsA family protein [Alphaproteobacteria bacterium]
MGLIILAIFIAVPVIEIALFIQVGERIGLWPTLSVVVLTAMAGTALLRHQGLGAIGRLQADLASGQPPVEAVFDGVCLMAAGLLLLTPGFFTDTVGFILFLPPARRFLMRRLAKRVHMHVHHGPMGSGFAASAPDSCSMGTVIDAEFEDVTRADDDKSQGCPRR